MNNYVTIRIMKKYLVLLGIVFALICSVCGYYIWSSNHPKIDIQVSESGWGNLKIEAPHITIIDNNWVKTAASVDLKVKEIWIQHELILQYLKDNFESSDIKLDMKIVGKQTFLNYFGTVKDKEGNTSDFDREIILDFVLSKNIY